MREAATVNAQSRPLSATVNAWTTQLSTALSGITRAAFVAFRGSWRSLFPCDVWTGRLNDQPALAHFERRRCVDGVDFAQRV